MNNNYSLAKLKDTKYEVTHLVGQGQAGYVYKAIDKELGQSLVVKIYSKDERPNEVNTEKRILSILPPHPNVIRMHDYIEKTNHAYFFLEFGGKDVWEHLKDVGGSLTVYEALPIFKQMLDALIHCHHHRICHHDVKLENFLLDRDTNRIKLIDFGFARMYKENASSSNFYCSPAYASLNVLLRTPYNPEKSDVFSLGVCFYRTLFGVFPFCDPDRDHLKTLIDNMKRTVDLIMPQTENSPHLVKTLLKGMLQVQESKRFGLEQSVALCKNLLDHHHHSDKFSEKH
eukprot:TRINITY_DN8145_c0_g1_i1.p1 TRINITY_DN8145_c0_g1~~TRINITY_DN8145_c0_g1_i1.p1  ORF type:complete len:303 (-),score=39.48 TRINITY_DN8145_c0_g1_i1:38-895(-)